MNQLSNYVYTLASQLFKFYNILKLPFNGFNAYIPVFAHPVSTIENTVGQRTRVLLAPLLNSAITGDIT